MVLEEREQDKASGFVWGQGWQDRVVEKKEQRERQDLAFRAECRWCSKRGLSAGRCHQKDEYTEQFRRKGGHKGHTGAYSMEEGHPSGDDTDGSLS